MIAFSCRCRHRFELDENEAGGLAQCPQCGRLNDVPTLSDLPNLGDDGTYQLDASEPIAPDPNRVKELGYVFTRHTRDDHGQEIDLRLTPEELAKAGTRNPPQGSGVRAVGNRPRYDPESGELIRPVEIKPDPLDHVDPATIPMAKATVNYASVPSAQSMSARWTLVRLLLPINLLVMGIIFFLHVSVQLVVGFFFGAGIVLISPVLIMLQFLIVAHYGNVIDELGPAGNDELPRFLRDLRFGEDIWSPMLAMLGGFFICYGPALLCLLAVTAGPSWCFVACLFIGFVTVFLVLLRLAIALMPMELSDVRWGEDILLPIGVMIAGLVLILGPAAVCSLIGASTPSIIATGGTLALIGTLLAPAVILTLATSGSSINLRPDRVIESIRVCGPRYLIPLGAWVLALPLYFFGLLGTSLGSNFIAIGTLKSTLWMKSAALTLPPLMIGIYFMHFFCWEIALLYRLHHDQFPWLFQRHEKRETVRLHRVAPRINSIRQ